MMWPNQITGANAGQRPGFAGKSRDVLSHRPGVAQFHRLPANDAGKRADKPPACSHVTGRCTVARRARDAGQPLIALNVRSTVSGWSRPSRTFFRALGVSAGGSSARSAHPRT